MFRKSIASAVCLFGFASGLLFTQGEAEESSLTWGVPEKSLRGSEELKERILFSSLQEEVRHKVESAFSSMGVDYDLKVEEGVVPCQFSVFFDDKDAEKVEKVGILLAKQDVYFLEDFEGKQEAWNAWSQQDQDLYLSPAYVSLLDKSDKRELTRDSLVTRKNESLKSSFSRQMGKGYGARPKLTALHLKDAGYGMLASNPYESLSITPEIENSLRGFVIDLDLKTIEEIMENRETLEGLKYSIDAIHPLKLAGFVFADPTCIGHARNIMNTEVKQNLFIVLMQIEIQTAKENGSLDRYLPGFVEHLGLDGNAVWGYINSMDYRGLIRYVLKM